MNQKFFLLFWIVLFFNGIFNGTLFSQTGAKDDIEKRAKRLDNEIMAPCCFGGTLAQHAESPLTVEMKARLRSLLKQGMSDKQVIDNMVEHYGKQMNLPPNQWERIRATPEAKGFNLLVWFLPILALIAGGILVYFILSKFVKEGKKSGHHSQSSANHALVQDSEMSQRIQKELENYKY